MAALLSDMKRLLRRSGDVDFADQGIWWDVIFFLFLGWKIAVKSGQSAGCRQQSAAILNPAFHLCFNQNFRKFWHNGSTFSVTCGENLPNNTVNVFISTNYCIISNNCLGWVIIISFEPKGKIIRGRGGGLLQKLLVGSCAIHVNILFYSLNMISIWFLWLKFSMSISSMSSTLWVMNQSCWIRNTKFWTYQLSCFEG